MHTYAKYHELGEKIIKILTHMKRRKTSNKNNNTGQGHVVAVVWGGMQGAFTHTTLFKVEGGSQLCF